MEISLLEGELDPLVDGIVELVTHGMIGKAHLVMPLSRPA